MFLLYILYIIAIIVFATWICWIIKGTIYPIYKESKYLKNIYYKVRWIAIKRPFGYLDSKAEVRDKDLIEYIIDEQYNLDIESKYTIENEDEKAFACEILEIYRKYIMETYLAESFKQAKGIYDLSFLEFYIE